MACLGHSGDILSVLCGSSASLADVRAVARISLCSQGLKSSRHELRAEVTAPLAVLLLVRAAEVTAILGERPRSQSISVSLCF